MLDECKTYFSEMFNIMAGEMRKISSDFAESNVFNRQLKHEAAELRVKLEFLEVEKKANMDK